MSGTPDRDGALAILATNLSSLADPVARRTARLLARQELLRLRFRSRRYLAFAKMFDGLSRFGGGSLLTSVLLLMLGGKYNGGIIAMAALTLLCFAGGAIFTARMELRAAMADHAADRVDAALKETER